MFTMPKSEAPMTHQIQSKKKPTNEKKIAANKRNSKKSPGPNDTSKTKYNALKHGLRATGVSMLESAAESDELLRQLMEEKKPVGAIETALVKIIGEQLIRLQRATRIEADYIDESIEYPHPPPFFTGLVKPRLRPQPAEALVRIYQRYATTAFNTFRHALHELERQQRMRLGEAVPVPAALDLNLHVDAYKEKAEPEPPIIEQPFQELKAEGVK